MRPRFPAATGLGRLRPADVRNGLRRLLLAAAVAATAACASGNQPATRSFDELRHALSGRDYQRAAQLVDANPRDLDYERALDMSIRLGDADGVGHFLPRVGPDALLDLDHTTPLIRTVVAAPAPSKQKLVKLLLEAGADAGQADRYGRDARHYAVTRAEFDIARMLGATGLPPPRGAGRAAIERWLPQAAQAPSTPARVTPAKRPAAGRGAPGSQRAAATPMRLEAGALMLRSPWVPDGAQTARGGVAAFRFHGDGTADVLTYRPEASRFDPMPKMHAAWRLDEGALQVGVVGERFSALCIGTGAGGDAIALACTDPEPEPAHAASLRLAGTDGARVVLAAASGGPGPGDDAPVLATIRPHRGASCKPASARPAPPSPASARAAGDWHVFDSGRFALHSPLSGRACVQSEARQAALAECSRSSKACRSLGGCRAGQVSAVAAMPGVDGGWLACGAGYEEARSAALQACRVALGCDCQLVAIFGQNVNTNRDRICRAQP